MILGLCDRFKKLPSEVEAESADLIRLIEIQRMGHKQKDTGIPEEGLE